MALTCYAGHCEEAKWLKQSHNGSHFFGDCRAVFAMMGKVKFGDCG